MEKVQTKNKLLAMYEEKTKVEHVPEPFHFFEGYSEDQHKYQWIITGTDTTNVDQLVKHNERRIREVIPYFNFNGGISYFVKATHFGDHRLYSIISHKSLKGAIVSEIRPHHIDTAISIDIVTKKPPGLKTSIPLNIYFEQEQKNFNKMRSIFTQLTDSSHSPLDLIKTNDQDKLLMQLTSTSFTFHTKNNDESTMLYSTSLTNREILYSSVFQEDKKSYIPDFAYVYEEKEKTVLKINIQSPINIKNMTSLQPSDHNSNRKPVNKKGVSIHTKTESTMDLI